jgi:ATP-dependent protease Clp ATPase subunit
MQLTNQKIPLESLNKYAESKKQALILSGSSGVGKTYLAKEYRKMLDIPDFDVVDPKVDDIRQMMCETAQL